MHSIERYGAIALIFLVVTVMAVLMWDSGDHSKAPGKDLAKAPPRTERHAAPPRAAEARPAGPAANAAQDAVATLSTRPVPLRRDLQPRALEQPAAPATPPAEGRREPTRASATPPAPELSSAAALDTREEGRPPAKPLARPEPHLYTVKGGDTLSEISQRELGTSKRWTEIVDLNPGLDPAKLLVGTRLRLPEEGAAPASISTPAPTRTAATPPPSLPEHASAPAAGRTYEVRRGDSLWRIAQHALGDGNRWKELADLNPGLDVDHLHEGAKLRLPEGAEPVPAAASEPLVARNETPRQGGKGRVR